MKKVIIIFILAILFSCEKTKIEPEKELLTIQAFIYNAELQNSNLAFVLSGDEVNYFESKEIKVDGHSIVFSYEFYVNKQKDVNLNIYGNDSTTMMIQAYTDPGKKSFKIVDKNQYKIRVIENGFKNVVIE